MSRVLAIVDALVALALSVFGVILVSGLVKNNTKHSGAVAAVGVLLMTAPVAWRRRAPVAVAAVLGAGALINIFGIGYMIRCGPSLPALLLGAYALGRPPLRLGSTVAGFGLACLLLSATLQSLTDPQLGGEVMVAMGPMILGLYGVALLVASRTKLAGQLAERNEELRRQRQRRTELAVEADRARIAQGLDTTLNAHIGEMEVAAATGRRALTEDQSDQAAQHAFETIQDQGRQTLTHMRRLVGTLLEADTERAPQPSLSQLDRLVERAGTADVHLHVSGAPTVLPGGIEVSAYRTLEHLLDAFGDAPSQRIDVAVDFATEVLSLTVRGPVPPNVDVQSALASAQARVDVHHGSLSSTYAGEEWETQVRLPLPDGD